MLLLFGWVFALWACAHPVFALPQPTSNDTISAANLTDANMFHYESALLVRIGELSIAWRDLKIYRVELTSTIGDVTSIVSTSIHLVAYSPASNTILETSTLATVPVRWSDPTRRHAKLGDEMLWTWYMAPGIHFVPAVHLAAQQGYPGPWKNLRLGRLIHPPMAVPSGFVYEFDRQGRPQHIVMAAYTGHIVSWRGHGSSANDITADSGQNSSTPEIS